MRPVRTLAAAAAVSCAAACTSPTWAEKSAVRSAPFQGTLYVPRLFAPLVPGSVYPDRRKPVPARSRPGVVVVARAAADARAAAEALGRERMVVLHAASGANELEAARAWLAARPECAGARLGAVLVAPPELPELEGFAAVALVGYTPATGARRLEHGARAAAFFVTADGAPREEDAARTRAELGDALVEKWYRAASPAYPSELWRDVAGFLSGDLTR